MKTLVGWAEDPEPGGYDVARGRRYELDPYPGAAGWTATTYGCAAVPQTLTVTFPMAGAAPTGITATTTYPYGKTTTIFTWEVHGDGHAQL